MLKRLLPYYRPHRRLFFADLLAALLLAGCDLVYPLITRNMINDYIPNRRLDLLLMFAGVLIALYILKLAMNYFVQYYGHLVGVYMQADLRRDVFAHLEKLPLSYFDNHKTGSIMSRIVGDLMDIAELAHHGPEDLFISSVMLLGSFIVMARIHLPLTLILFSMIPLMILFSAKTRLKMSAAFTLSREKVSVINAGLENSISGIRVTKAYDNAAYENRHFEAGNSAFVSARTKAYQAMAQFHSGNTFISDILMVAMYTAGGLFFFFGKLPLADFVAFLLYISIFLNPIRRLISFVEQYQDGIAGLRRVCEILDTPAEIDSPQAIELPPVKGDITFEDVSFSYEDGTKVLDHLSFHVPAGKTLALVGPSGGGKTTICHLIPRFYEIENGTIEIDGYSIMQVTRASLRRQIGIVSQDCFLFNASVYDNIAYGCPEATKEQVYRAAQLANIDAFVSALPHGYDTEVGERGVKLSGGQKQRVAIARAFLKNPPILILDEATSALDNATEQLIQESLAALSRGRTTIVVAHRLSTVQNADEILVINDEGVAERGTHTTLLSHNGIYAALWRSTTQKNGPSCMTCVQREDEGA